MFPPYSREQGNPDTFSLEYDRLVIGVGADTNDFGIPGVKEHAYFLKVTRVSPLLSSQELRDARRIRTRIVELFEKASIPSRSVEEKRQLLHIVIVGGGPTGVEVLFSSLIFSPFQFAGELTDFFWSVASLANLTISGMTSPSTSPTCP